MRLHAGYKERAALFAAAGLVFFLILPHRAGAIVGRSSDGARWQNQVVMILSRSGRRAGFCSGIVLAPNVILTAAHCVAAAGDARVYVPDRDGHSHVLALTGIAKHPGFHADAARTRSRSIDLALLQTADALPAEFTPPAFADAARYDVGAAFDIAGYGLAREGEAKSSGILRTGRVALRAPLSSVLLWLEDPERETGACTGDSGGPVFTPDGKLAALIAFAEDRARDNAASSRRQS